MVLIKLKTFYYASGAFQHLIIFLRGKQVKKNVKGLEKKVYPVPVEIDREIALYKLTSMNVDVDELTKTQKNYMDNWQEGT